MELNSIEDTFNFSKKVGSIISRGDIEPTLSVIDKVKESSDDTPKIPENNN